MAKRHKRLKPAAYCVINLAVFAVCAFTFFRVGQHHAVKPETASAPDTESFSDADSITITSLTTTSSETTQTTTTALPPASLEHSWYDEPWGWPYKDLLWSGEYLNAFQKDIIAYHSGSGGDPYRLTHSEINIYAALIYLDDDDIPELALSSEIYTMIYTYADDQAQLVDAFETYNMMHYIPRKSLLADDFYKTMGGFYHTNVYDYSKNGLKNGAEIKLLFDDMNGTTDSEFGMYKAEDYDLIPSRLCFTYGESWKPLNENACLISAFMPDDAIGTLYAGIMKGAESSNN